MADIYEKKQGEKLTTGEIAYRNAEGLITSDPTDAVRVGVVMVDAAAEDASVMVETEGRIAYEAQIAQQRANVAGVHAVTWPAWETLTDEARAKWNDAEWRASAAKGA